MELKELPQRLYAWFKSKRFGRSSVDTRYALLEACLIGILSALAALLLKEGIGWLGGWRLWAARQLGAGFVLPVAGLSLGWLAGWLMEWLSPQAAGGGIPQVKAALARYPIPLSLRVALVKLAGTTLVLGAGLPLGRRAPTVHIGAALAAQLSQWVPTSPEHRRQMIAAGAAAGLAAGFGTPIAGMLFVVEELMRDVSGLTLETAIVASFTGAVVSLILQSADLNFPPSLLAVPSIHFSASDIPTCFFLGGLAGILGGLFNRGMIGLVKFNRRLNWPLSWRIGAAGLISGAIIALLPPFFRDNSGLREFVITGELSWQHIALALAAHFFLTIVAYSSGAPGGLFAPALVMGSALGYLVGNGEAWLSGTGEQATYALAGMGAFFTAVVRVPATAIVIVFELTENFNIVLPLMITCAVAYIVAETVYPRSIYEHLLEVSGIFLKEEAPSKDFLSQLTAADVMQSQVESFSSDLTLEEVLPAMSLSHHRGFPVLEGGKLVGIVTQTDLANLGTRAGATPLREIMTPEPIAVRPDASLSDVLYLLNRYQLSRLPVTENQKLVGIITRSDIIRVEANQLGGGLPKTAPLRPSYVTYQTRSPAVGQGRILLPLANPQTALDLFQIAAGLARQHNYEIECLQVIQVPKHSLPDQVSVDLRASRKLLHRVARLGRHWQLPVHTQIRVAQDPAAAILEVIQERHANLLLMGWKGSTSTTGAIFGGMTDTLIRQAPGDLVLVKLGTSPRAYPHHLKVEGTWLVPMAGGPNVQRAIELLPGLTGLYADPAFPQLWLCKIYPPSEAMPDCGEIERAAQSIRQQFHKTAVPISIPSQSVSEAVIRLAAGEGCDAVLIGASREGLLQQAIHGNIPEAIAQGVDCTVILVRSAKVGEE